MRSLRIEKNIMVKDKASVKAYKSYSRKKNQGRSLVEVMSALFISTLVTLVIVNMYANTMKYYLRAREIDNTSMTLCEAVMYIDYYINYVGEKYYIENSRLYIEGNKGERKNYIYLFDSDLRIAYKNSSNNGYTSQPILYDVQEFNLSVNKEVIFVEIITKSGEKIKKAIGRI